MRDNVDNFISYMRKCQEHKNDTNYISPFYTLIMLTITPEISNYLSWLQYLNFTTLSKSYTDLKHVIYGL